MATGMLLVRTNLLERAHGSGEYDPAASENHGALGGVEQFHGAVEFFLVVIVAIALRWKLRSRGFKIEFRGGLLGVLGNVDEDGAGTAGIGDDEGFANRARNVLHFGHHDVVFGDRHGDAGDVHFLERIGAEELAAHLPGDADHRRRIEHRRRDAGDHVGCAGTRGRHCHSHAAAGARVTVGHVRGALLVAHENVMQLGLTDGVVDRKNRAARIAENVPHPEMLERLAEYLRTSELHKVLPVETGAEPEEKLAGTEVMAPRDEEETSKAYLAMTPLTKRGFGACHAARRFWISASVSSTFSVRFGRSKVMVSPSRTAAIGPPTAASGATWPAIKSVSGAGETAVGEKRDRIA